MGYRFLVGLSLATLVSSVAYADTFRFTGATTVDMTVAKGALKNIQLIGLGTLGCGTIGAVEAEVLPPSYSPRNTDNYAGSAKETYERWTVTLCGKATPFLLGFWPASDGGMMFHVSYPFPPDASAKP
jgi:hypothetical protein